MNASHRLVNHFLIAMPSLEGSYFGGTLTYMCQHNDDGALGIMINRPTDFDLATLLAQLDIEGHAAGGCQVMEGGPVSRELGFILHDNDSTVAPWQSTQRVCDAISLTTSKDILVDIPNDRGPRDFLVAVGYAGWGGGQLERELSESAWLTCPADPEIVFHAPAQERVRLAADSLGIDLNLLSGNTGIS